MLQSHHLHTHNFPFTLSHRHSLLSPVSPTSSPPLHCPCRPTTLLSVRAHIRTRPESWLAEAQPPEIPTTTTTSTVTPTESKLQDGPIELPSSSSSIFATTDEPSPLQVATSVLLTGAISVFLFRSLRRRAKRAKELRFRSTGAKKSLKEEALDNLKSLSPTAVNPGSPPSPIQALLGGLSAGVIALVLYKFTTTIEAALNRQTISDNFSVRQITITIRTIVNGLCYLATFVFGLNSVGLILYSGQLAINSLTEGSTSKAVSGSDDGEQMSSLSTKGPMENEDSSNSDGDQTTV
ncbi:PREDICTED: uncharacterized protein LOC104599495 [Nelumbo nucifera]|uniref:Uncharacterized protein LOC104599495 n=1 Tax=Nelumbo nucifera TaxID=4432 RepID=A0A1U8A2B4_NELNU|nr:PREDICTED: uncharacterized protein LOC104599495 [Nelumbo nucifera]XP_010260360.1 PREDICTED: uncharacterized protein LOC104599495 [Nelumbo nucifera]